MATIMERSRTKEIIDRLQGILNNASPVPLSAGKVTVYKDEVQSLLSELASQIDMELRTYHEVNDRKGKIINEAKKEAEKIIYEAEHTASRMRVTKRATNVAPLNYDTLNDEERSALGNANEIYGASLIYTDEMLSEVTNIIADAYHNIRSDYEIILQVLEEKMNTISANRTELMDGLQEMEVEDRSQQILEIGQLLSTELYNTRMKAKMNSDEYEDGSVQLSIDFEEQEEKARQAEAEAERAALELAKMKAERDALMETVKQMKSEGSKTETSKINRSKVDDEEYEVVYVTEDELEEGEEYEVEYVDDIEEEIEAQKETDKAVKEAAVTVEKTSKEFVKMSDSGLPVIPHFKKSEKETEKAEDNVTKLSEVRKTEKSSKAERKKDEDIKTDANGNEYVQATMKFDEDFEILDFD